MNFSQPPPDMASPPMSGIMALSGAQSMNFSMPPPGMPPQRGGFHHDRGGGGKSGFYRPHFNAGFVRGPGGLPMTQDDFDGKRLRKSVMRKTVDYNASIIKTLQVNFSLIVFIYFEGSNLNKTLFF